MAIAYMKTNIFLCVIYLAISNVVSTGDDECYSDDACTRSKYCCDRDYSENSVCRSECIGESCFFDSNCAPGESCGVNDKCKKKETSEVYLIILVSALVFLTVLGIAAFVIRRCRANAPAGSASRDVVVTQLERTPAVHATQNQQQYEQPGCINRQPMTVYFRQISQPSTNQPPLQESPNSPPPPYRNQPPPSYPNYPPPPYPAD